MITADAALKNLLRVAEAVALEECKAKQHGREPRPVQHDDQEQWCLSSLPSKAVADYLNA